MRIHRLAYGLWSAFCVHCHRGMMQGGEDALFDWAINHAARHQKAEAQ